MSDRKLRWGIMSTAKIGRGEVIPAIQSSKNGIVTAIASRDAQKGTEFANMLGIPRAYGSYEALLDDPDIDAVYIPLPNSLHYEWTIKAARAGKHILCEKPMALNSAQCLEMGAAAKENEVLLMEAFMYRFLPRTEKLIEMVHAGTLGSLKMIQSSFTFNLSHPENIRFNPDLGGGSLMDIGCYCVNIARSLAGEEPEAVQALAIWAPSGVDERMIGCMRFTNGLMAQFDCALTLARRESCMAAGTNGYFDVPKPFRPGDGDSYLYEHREGKEIQHHFSGCDEYQPMVEHFSDCVLNHKPVRYPATEAAANMSVIESLYLSAHHGGEWQSVHNLDG